METFYRADSRCKVASTLATTDASHDILAADRVSILARGCHVVLLKLVQLVLVLY